MFNISHKSKGLTCLAVFLYFCDFNVLNCGVKPSCQKVYRILFWNRKRGAFLKFLFSLRHEVNEFVGSNEGESLYCAFLSQVHCSQKDSIPVCCLIAVRGAVWCSQVAAVGDRSGYFYFFDVRFNCYAGRFFVVVDHF